MTDLVLREALLGKVEESFLSLVKVEDSFGERDFEVTDARLFVGHRVTHAVRDEAREVVCEIESVVVLYDVLLDQRDRQVRQVAEALLSVDTEVVLVLPSVAGGLGIDELAATPNLLATVAVEQLLQVVKVRAVATSRRGPFFQDLLDERE